MTDRDNSSPDSFFAGVRKPTFTATPKQLIPERFDKFTNNNGALNQHTSSIERKLLASKDTLLQRRTTHNTIFETRRSPVDFSPSAATTAALQTSLSKANSSPAHSSAVQLTQAYQAPSVRGAKASPRRNVIEDVYQSSKNNSNNANPRISAIQDQYYYQQTKESKVANLSNATNIPNYSTKIALNNSNTSRDTSSKTKTPLIVKLLADRAERSLDSKISKRNNSSGGKNTNNYQQQYQGVDLNSANLKEAHPASYLATPSGQTPRDKRNEEWDITTDTRSPPKVSSFRQKSTKFFPSQIPGITVAADLLIGVSPSKNEEKITSNSSLDKNKQISTNQSLGKERKTNPLLKNVIVVPYSYLRPSSNFTSGSPLRARKEDTSDVVLNKPQTVNSNLKNKQNSPSNINIPVDNTNGVGSNVLNGTNSQSILNNTINFGTNKNPSSNSFIHSFKMPANVQSSNNNINNLNMQQQSSPEAMNAIINLNENEKRNIHPRNQGSRGNVGEGSSTSLGRYSNKETDQLFNAILKENSITLRSKDNLQQQTSKSSKALVIHRIPTDLRGGASGSANQLESRGSPRGIQTKQYSFGRNSDATIRGGSSDTLSAAKQSSNVMASSRIGNHQQSSQSQSTTLIESTQTDKDKIRQLEEAKFIVEMAKENPTMEDFTLLQVLGNGSYAVVRAAVHKKTHFQVAVKSYDKVKLQDPQKKQNVEREVKILSNLNHKHIVKLYKVIESSDCVNLVMEYTPCLPMNKYIKSKPNKRLHEYEARIIFRQLVEAVLYLHRKLVLHRDIKLENILIDQDRQVKLIDFGFSVVLPAQGQKINMFCGTPTYMAPEIVGKAGYTFPVDVWALGVLLTKSLTGDFPFQGSTDKALYQSIMRAKVDFPVYISQQGKDLIEQILCEDPNKRITLQEVLKNEWLEWR